MTEVKPVIQWKPKRAEKRNVSGEIVPGEFVGKFRTKVPANTPGAFHYSGENDAGVKWDFWGKDVDSIAGVVRWIDVQSSDYGSNIILSLESSKALHQIIAPYDVGNMKQIMNHLCGLGKELEVSVLNVSYWVRKKLDAQKRPKLDLKGNPIWAKDLSFRDIPEKWPFEEWKTFAAQSGLEWVKETWNGREQWNYTAEMNFWLSKLVGVQRFLLGTEKCLPFCWNSITACEKPSPGGNLTKEEIATASAIYEAVKPLYQFSFSRTDIGADSILDEQPAPATQPKYDPFPTVEQGRDFEDSTPEFQDLPF